MGQTRGYRCECGRHGKRSEQDERTVAPAVAQPMSEEYRPEFAQTFPEVADAVAIASTVTAVLGVGVSQSVAPEYKVGNPLGLRNVSVSASDGGGCDCGSH